MTIKNKIEQELSKYNETWNDVENHTINKDYLNAEYSKDGPPMYAFNLWTKSRVYFTTRYDGTEGIDSISKHPTENIHILDSGDSCSCDLYKHTGMDLNRNFMAEKEMKKL